MGHFILRLFPDGRVEQSVHARTWKEREELIAFGLYLQPGLAALDVSARVWRDFAIPTRPTRGLARGVLGAADSSGRRARQRGRANQLQVRLGEISHKRPKAGVAAEGAS